MKYKFIFVISLVIALLAVFTLCPLAMWQSSSEEQIVPNSGFVVPEFILQDNDYEKQYYKPQSIQTFTPSLSEGIYDAVDSGITRTSYTDILVFDVDSIYPFEYLTVQEYLGYSYKYDSLPEVLYMVDVIRNDDPGQYGTFYINYDFVSVPFEDEYTWYISFFTEDIQDFTSVSLNVTGYSVSDSGVGYQSSSTITENVFVSDPDDENISIVDLAFLVPASVGAGFDAYSVSLKIEYDYTPEIQFFCHNSVRESTNENGDNIYKSDVEPFSARMINITEVSYADFNLLSWLGTALDGFANTPLFVLGQAPDTFTVTVGGLLAVTLALPLFIAFLKKFAGG